MTLLSRISGLVRDVVFARIFGADAATDAFFVAFKIPNLLRRQFAEGAFSQAFVPVFTEYQTTREHDQVRRLAGDVAGTLAVVLFALTALGVLTAPILVVVFAPGWVGGDPRYDLTTEMLRFTFPYILFISLTALAGGILNTYGRFAVPAFTPVLLNLCLIGAAILSTRFFDNAIVVLAWGVFVAGVVQLAFQFPYLARLRLLTRPRWAWREPGVHKIKTLMVPALFSSSVQQINLIVDYWIASFLIAGSISWLYYADRLVEFPLGVFGIAIATVILPSLSAKFAADDPARFRQTLDWGLRLSLLVAAPATIGLTLLAGPLICAMFQYGEFDLHDVEMARIALVAYAIGLIGFIYVKVLSPGFFARQDTRTPMKIAFISMGIKILMTLLIVLTMTGLNYAAPHVGLALATALSALLQSWLLYRGLVREGIYRPEPGWAIFLLRLGMACLALAAVLSYGVEPLETWADWTVYQRAWKILVWVTAGCSVYFLVLWATGMKLKAFVRHH